MGERAAAGGARVGRSWAHPRIAGGPSCGGGVVRACWGEAAAAALGAACFVGLVWPAGG